MFQFLLLQLYLYGTRGVLQWISIKNHCVTLESPTGPVGWGHSRRRLSGRILRITFAVTQGKITSDAVLRQTDVQNQ